jgi:hypothetical protein
MKRFFLVIILWSIYGQAGWSQLPDSNLVFMKQDIRFFSLDPLQQLLAVDQEGALIKYDRGGKELFRYHNTILGDIGAIDAADPFNILLFFPEQQTIALLDRTLGDQGELDLRTTIVQNATAALRSHDNNIWVYDDYAGRLYMLSPRGKLLFTSNDFRLSDKLYGGATHIWRNGNRLLLNFPERGVAVLTLFGQLEEWWPLEGITDGFLLEDQFYFRQNGEYQRFLPAQQLVQKIAWPKEEAPVLYRRQLRYQYLLNKEGVLKVSSH